MSVLTIPHFFFEGVILHCRRISKFSGPSLSLSTGILFDISVFLVVYPSGTLPSKSSLFIDYICITLLVHRPTVHPRTENLVTLWKIRLYLSISFCNSSLQCSRLNQNYPSESKLVRLTSLWPCLCPYGHPLRTLSSPFSPTTGFLVLPSPHPPFLTTLRST